MRIHQGSAKRKADPSIRAYFDSITRYPLLTRREEYDLFSQMTWARHSMVKILSTHGKEALGINDTPLEDMKLESLAFEKLEKLGVRFIEFAHKKRRKEWKLLGEQCAGYLSEISKNRYVASESNLKLVISVAKKHRNRGVSFLDLIQFGNIGLMKAVWKFDSNRKNKFSTYAVWWIAQQIARGVINHSSTVRRPSNIRREFHQFLETKNLLEKELCRKPTIADVAKRMGKSRKFIEELIGFFQGELSIDTPLPLEDSDNKISDTMEHPNPVSPEVSISNQDLSKILNRMLKQLSPREQTILRVRFGLDNDNPLSLKEVGEKLGVSRERIRQIQRQALNRLRRRLRWEGHAKELVASL